MAAANAALTSQRGKPLAVLNDHLYSQLKLTKDGETQLWRCVFLNSGEHKGCKGSAISAVGAFELEQTSEHSHGPVPHEIERRKKLLALDRQAAEQVHVPTRHLVAQAYNGISAAAAEEMPEGPSLSRRIQRKRAPENGAQIDCNPVDIQWDRRSVETNEGTRYLLVDSRTAEPNASVFLVFASSTGIQLLRDVRTWAYDGTFYSSPQHFAQLFTVNVITDTHSAPALFFLLPDKSEATYQRALTAAFAHPELQGLQPDVVVSDFERASLNVFKALFPQAEVQHCYFHFHQLLYRNLQAKGLSILYREVLPVRVLLRCLAALAFLPPAEVPDALEEVGQALNDKLNDGTIPQQYSYDLFDYLEYFQRQFVYRLVAGRLQPPAYSPATWSCYAAVVNDLPRTNNAMESWHRAFNGYFNLAHVRLSLFLSYLRMEETTLRRRVRRGQLNGVQLQARNRRAQFAARDKKIKNEVLRYRDTQPGQRHRLHFLKSIQNLLSKASFNENAGAAGGGQ